MSASYKPIQLSGSLTSEDTGIVLVLSQPLTFVVSKDKDFFVAKNDDLGVHAVSRDVMQLKSELVEEIIFVLKHVADKPRYANLVKVGAILEPSEDTIDEE